ncbi:threonine/homoserine/homoserine lactone efflux protein [Angulomicrobium tetraedrale]|uniref:Threonine/homoserine/homoserine lactone efflux protein n=1 Tax=Ancylobacter tetraedralis TaxID=217068 RepID=A0A839Z633_9HYPH|nr:LysE family transporter [Ancylobacter tetraedralis]MBB3769786.1 threonine/homoserine/homoserine lactone efflux protein [Ancylobacter tetraedralis]
MTDPVLFVLAVLAILATPGPTNTLLATAGAAVGWRRALPLVPAEAAGYLIAISAISAIGLALGPVVAAAPMLALGLRLMVGLYLLFVAWKLWRGAGLPIAGPGLVTPGRIFLTTLLNPKAIVFALGVVPFNAPAWPGYLMAFALLTATVALGWIALGALLGHAADAAGRASLVPRLGAAVVSAFAVMLLTPPLLR